MAWSRPRAGDDKVVGSSFFVLSYRVGEGRQIRSESEAEQTGVKLWLRRKRASLGNSAFSMYPYPVADRHTAHRP